MDLEIFLKRMLNNKKNSSFVDEMENQSEACSEYSNDFLTEIEHNSYVTADMREYVENKFEKSIRNHSYVFPRSS